MPKIPGENLSGGLTAFALDEWFEDRETSSVWLRIYTSLFVPHDDFQSTVESFLPDLEQDQRFLALGRPILFACGRVQDLKVPTTQFDMFALPTGELMVKLKADQKELPDTNYIFLATPFRVDGEPGIEHETRRLLDVAVPLLAVHTGLNFLRHCVFEGEVRAHDGSFTVPGKPWKMPKPSEGPFLARQNGSDIAEITDRVSNLRQPKRRRCDLALELLDTAMRKDNGFFEYWTALEVICDGKTNKIKTRLKELYALKNHQEAADQTGLTTLARWRDDYVHKGIRPPLTADLERYLQLLFLDLLRQEIDLPLRSHIATIQRATGYDLSPIGLSDRRTVEQKKAEETTPDHTTGTSEEGTSA